jgi:hypothetical protein
MGGCRPEGFHANSHGNQALKEGVSCALQQPAQMGNEVLALLPPCRLLEKLGDFHKRLPGISGHAVQRRTKKMER